MDKLFIKEFNFILEPSYSKISKSISNITKELINIVGKQYSNIINERVLRTNFVFFNKIPDIKKYCLENEENIKEQNDKKIDAKYSQIEKEIKNYEVKLQQLRKKLSNNFILEIQDNLSSNDRVYIKNHKKIDLNKLECYDVFFSKSSDKLINGLFDYFSNFYEEKINNKSTSISELETIFNNREKCLKLIGLKNINVRVFDKKILENIFFIIDKYNEKYKTEEQCISINKTQIINEFLLSEKKINEAKNNKVSDYFSKLLKNNKNEIVKMNDKIINRMLEIDKPEIIWASDNCSDDNNMRFLLFSPTMDFEHNDFLFVKEICRLAFNSENFNNKSLVKENSIIGKDKYFMFCNLIIDYIAYQITKRLNENKDIIINSKKNKNITDFNESLFLVDKFYSNYNASIIESLINNDNKYIYNEIGVLNFENFVNIINKFFYNPHGILLSKKERSKEVFINTIKNILTISLNNMEQYKKILIEKNKYSVNN